MLCLVDCAIGQAPSFGMNRPRTAASVLHRLPVPEGPLVFDYGYKILKLDCVVQVLAAGRSQM